VPEGFEEVPVGEGLELAAYTDAAGERRLREAFATVAGEDVPAGWADAWRSFHRPVRVGPLWIGPPWEEPERDAVGVVIDPGRAFGTGAHPTTRLSLELLLELPRGSLFDLGCGSGVIAIAAAKLGFSPVIAIDHDRAAVEAARRNAEANGVTIDVQGADVGVNPVPAAAVAVANIALDVVERAAARVGASTLVTSGYLAGERPALPAWRHRLRREADGWAADLFERGSSAGGTRRAEVPSK
jgi:ribosomal protein L11 methyltransferase